MTTDKAAFLYASMVYQACDSMDEQRFASFLTETCTFIYANSEPVVGRAQAAASVKGFMGLITGIQHDLLEVWRWDDTIVSRMTVTYTRKDGSQLTVPAMTCWRMLDGKIDEYLIYVDISPLFANSDSTVDA